MSKTIDFAVQFASCCNEHGFGAHELAELIRLVRLAVRAGEYDCNYGTDRSEKPRERVASQAAKLGLKTKWPGLYPSFTKDDGRVVYIPVV